MKDVKHNIDSFALMNVFVDFDELSIRVLNVLGPTYSHISHALQAQDTLVTFEELFEHLLSYEAQMKIFVHFTPPASALVTLISPSSHCRSNTCGRGLNSLGLYLPSSGNIDQLLLHCLRCIQLRRHCSGSTLSHPVQTRSSLFTLVVPHSSTSWFMLTI